MGGDKGQGGISRKATRCQGHGSGRCDGATCQSTGSGRGVLLTCRSSALLAHISEQYMYGATRGALWRRGGDGRQSETANRVRLKRKMCHRPSFSIEQCVSAAAVSAPYSYVRTIVTCTGTDTRRPASQTKSSECQTGYVYMYCESQSTKSTKAHNEITCYLCALESNGLPPASYVYTKSKRRKLETDNRVR